MDWNDQKYDEIWRQGWAATANRYLQANDRPERFDLRSYERQGLDKIPTVHMGTAVSQMEKKEIQTNIGNLNRDITAANRLMQSIRQMVRHLKGWIADLKEKKAALLEALQEAKEPTLPELLWVNIWICAERSAQAQRAKASSKACERFQQGHGCHPLSVGKGAVHRGGFGRLSEYRQWSGRFHLGRDEAEGKTHEGDRHPAFSHWQL